MAFRYHPDFLAGRYRAVVEDMLERPDLGQPEGYEPSLIGALSFLGRMDEAEARYAALARKKKTTSSLLVISRFFLAIGFTRKSDYRRARRIFAENARESGGTPFERFYVLQGRVFYCYYTGRFRAALRFAAKARRLALRSGDLFARAIADDAYGQCRVVAGEMHHGLRMLEEARDLARRLGNESVANSIEVSLELHDAELGLSGEKAIHRLEHRLAEVGTEDDYSLANVALELSRQYTRRGRFNDAAAALETAAPWIYAQRNRRQEITLNLRLAELAYQRGDRFGARHFLRFLDRLLHREADATFELAALGLGRKIALADGRTAEATELASRAQDLARDFGTTRDDNLQVRLGFLSPDRENREDKVHCVLQAARLLSAPSDKLRPLLEQELFTDAAEVAGIGPGANGLSVLPQGLGVLSRDSTGVHWQSGALSSLQAKLLRTLVAGANGAAIDKSALVEGVWGYKYDPLRHDPMVYSALSALRRALGAAGAWLQASELGYSFAAPVRWLDAPVAAARSAEQSAGAVEAAASMGTSLVPFDAALFPHLNHRQLEILAWMRGEAAGRFLAVADCRNKFQVSEITALRDLDGLRKQGLVVRNGKARATRYSLSGGTAP